MGQREKAAELAKNAGFTLTTTANSDEILSVLEGAAASAAPGGMKGTIVRLKKVDTAGGFDSTWQLKGPGGVASVCSFRVTVVSGESVAMELLEYKWQKGSLLMAPTLNGAKQLEAFQEAVRRHLSSAS